jgi:hypothetical protein
MGVYLASSRAKVVHRKPPRPACTSQLMPRMELNTVEVWMCLRTQVWTLCDRCFSLAEQATIYDQAKCGRPVEV